MTAPMHDAFLTYLRDLFVDEDEHLQQIRLESIERGIPQIHVLPEEGYLLHFMLRMLNARHVVEIGVLAGYSTTWITRALPSDGRVIALERNPEHADMAREYFLKAGLSDRIELLVGDATELLPTISPRSPFDAVFIDADKDSYPLYLDWAVDNLRIGGMIFAHNALLGGRILDGPGHDGAAEGMRIFHRKIAADTRLLGNIITLGDGMTIALRIA